MSASTFLALIPTYSLVMYSLKSEDGSNASILQQVSSGVTSTFPWKSNWQLLRCG